MAARDALLSRLRRLIDDIGHGYSQSAPSFITNLVPTGIVDPTIGVLIDDSVGVEDVLLLNIPVLETGLAIALSIQTAIRIINLDYANTVVTFDLKEGYILRSPTRGSKSQIRVSIPTTGTDVTDHLKLGSHVGGFESLPVLSFGDDELEDMLDEALAAQSEYSDTSWNYDALPQNYETVVVYRSWSSVTDAMLGRAAHQFPQKVGSEESSANEVFKNLLNLAKWVRKSIEEELESLEGGVTENTATVWDSELRVVVGMNAYSEDRHIPIIASIQEGDDATQVMLEYGDILTANPKRMYVAHSVAPDLPFDQSLLNEDGYDKYSEKALSSGAVLDKELKHLSYPIIKIKGLLPETDYVFQLQVLDQNGERYFSSPLTYTTPA